MPYDFQLHEAKKKARKKLKWWLNGVEESQVSVLGIVFHGGYESVMRLDAARRLTIEGGGTTVDFTDVNNIPHTLSLADAKTVCLTIGSDYQAKFAQKQAWSIQIDNATTIAGLPTIV